MEMIRRLRRCVRSLLYSEGMTPLPWKILMVLFSIMLINSMATTSCFSYLPRLVKSFGISEVDTGYYAGLILTSTYIGYILFSLVWGYLGDTKGNKWAVVLSISLMCMTTLAFGFSTSFYWTLIARILMGCSQGFLVLCKCILAKVLDQSNMNLGFSIFYTCWTFSYIIGPSAAGFLVFPATQYPGTFNKYSLFGWYGVLLPNIILVVTNDIILVAALILLPDDRPSEQDSNLREESLITYSNMSSSSSTDSIDNSIQKYTVNFTRGKVNKLMTGACCHHGSIWNKFKSRMPSGLRKIISLFKIRDFVIIIHAFALLGFCIIGIEEMFPVFAATAEEYHGLGLTTSEIGVVLLISSPFLLIIQVFVTSRVSKRYGEKKTFIACTLLLVFNVPILPTLRCIPSGTLQRSCTIVVMLLNQVSVNGTLVSLNILLNNVVTKDVYGVANGIAYAMHTLGRVIAPSAFGSLYTWSLKNVKGVAGNDQPLGFPFNQFFIFYVCSLSLVACALIVSMISPRVDRRTSNL